MHLQVEHGDPYRFSVGQRLRSGCAGAEGVIPTNDSDDDVIASTFRFDVVPALSEELHEARELVGVDWSNADSVTVSRYIKGLGVETCGEVDDVAVAMQKQALYLFPIMTVVVGLSFPSGLVLYWLTFSLTTLIQQLLLNKIRTKSRNGKKRVG